jgi:hypothetical protein
LQLRWISLLEKDSINAKAFLTVRTSGSKAWQELYGGPQSSSARAVREAYMNPLIPPSAIIFQSSLCSQQQAENSLNTSNHFHTLEMATFCPHLLYLCANCSAPQEHSNSPQTCPEAIQHPRQALAQQA